MSLKRCYVLLCADIGENIKDRIDGVGRATSKIANEIDVKTDNLDKFVASGVVKKITGFTKCVSVF